MSEIVLSGNSEYFDKVFEDNLKERRILINGEINADCIERVVLPILDFNRQDKYLEQSQKRPIWLLLSTNGGDVTTGMTIVDSIINSSTPVYGLVLDMAYSMGGLILLACHKKYCFKHSTILIHDGSINSGTTSGAKFKDLNNFLNETEERIKKFVLERSKMTEELYDQKYGSEFYMYPEKGKELGIIDYIIGEDCKLSEIL